MLPPFASLWTHYPFGEAAAVKTAIGGKVDMGWITNTCVIRLSRALNYSGEPIPRNHAGLNTVGGGDGLRYAYRVKEFHGYMIDTYGPPSIVSAGSSAAKFTSQRGVIMFDVAGWSDATGHFDLWDGSRCAGHDYFGMASEVLLWIAP